MTDEQKLADRRKFAGKYGRMSEENRKMVEDKVAQNMGAWKDMRKLHLQSVAYGLCCNVPWGAFASTDKEHIERLIDEQVILPAIMIANRLAKAQMSPDEYAKATFARTKALELDEDWKPEKENR